MKQGIYILLSLILLITISQCKAQSGINSTVQEEKSAAELDIYIEAQDFDVDPLGNIYFIGLNNEIYKYSPEFELQYRYSNDYLGNIAYLDVTNPMKIFAFYQDFQVLVFLDNTLSETGRIELQEFDIVDIRCVGLSNDNQIWVYNPELFKLQKITSEGNLELESNSILGEGIEDINPVKIIERQNKVYLHDQQKGILVFDNYGQFLKKIPITDSKHIQIQNDRVYFTENEGLFLWPENLIEDKRLVIQFDFESEILKPILGQRKAYILFSNGMKQIEL